MERQKSCRISRRSPIAAGASREVPAAAFVSPAAPVVAPALPAATVTGADWPERAWRSTTSTTARVSRATPITVKSVYAAMTKPATNSGNNIFVYRAERRMPKPTAGRIAAAAFSALSTLPLSASVTDWTTSAPKFSARKVGIA